MTGQARKKKIRLILDHESSMAFKLALLVIDRPNPPFWMTFVPMFLVFLNQKFRQHENDLKAFTSSYVESRQHAVTVLVRTSEGMDDRQTWSFVDKLDMPDNAREFYVRYVGLLAGHYGRLLYGEGSCIDCLTRQAYADRSVFEHFCRELNTVESELNFSLLPQIREEKDILLHVVQRMNDGIVRLRHEEADRIFP